MNDTPDNPRAVTGGNNPPPIWAFFRDLSKETNVSQTVTDWLNDEYKQWGPTVAGLLDEARAVQRPFPDKETRDKVPSIMKRIRDTSAKLDAFHKKEKEPFFRGGQAVDQKFFGLIDKLMRRDKKNNAGAYDILQAELTDFDNRVLAAEQAARELAAVETARVAKAAADKLAAEQAAADEARLAADRARAPAQVEAKTQVAQVAEQNASDAKVELTVANARAEEAHIMTLSKPADIMRTRLDDGTQSTMGQDKYAEVVDRTLLDFAKLAPYFAIADVQKALNGYAKATDYNAPMEGAKIGRRNKSKVL